MYIAFEGVDGCGKSTIHKMLKPQFPDANFIREPGTSKFAEDIRNAIFMNFKKLKPITIQLTMMAARSDLVQYIKPDELTISDRCFLSTAYCEELQDEEKIKEWLEISKKFIVIPDAIIYLDIDAETSIQRLSNRQITNDYDTLVVEEINKRIDSYMRWIRVTSEVFPSIQFFKVNSNQSIAEVQNAVLEIVNNLIKKEEICQQYQRADAPKVIQMP